MKTTTRLFALLVTTQCFLCGSGAEEGFKAIFNGKDLTEWDGNPKFWSVKDGTITGQTTAENPTRGNTFIVWKGGTVEDFELRLSYKIVGGNSGIQYRSKVVNQANWVVGGYQGDFEAGTRFSGILYDEAGVAGGRGIMAERGEKVIWDKDCKKQVTGSVGKSDEIQARIKKEDWNDYVIIAKGSHLRHFINGVPTVDVTEECESKQLKSGVLALQLHQGPPMTVQFKNIRIKPLPGAPSAKSDVDLLQGEWRPVEIVANGEKVPEDGLQNIKVIIKGNRYTVESNEGDSGSFKIVESGLPKRMDVTSDGGAELQAIYEIAGDTFKACYGINGASRPTEFSSEAGSDRVFAVYKRKAQ